MTTIQHTLEGFIPAGEFSRAPDNPPFLANISPDNAGVLTSRESIAGRPGRRKEPTQIG
ncbi:MAG: hypothetical protein NDI90_19755 [Nitrospira sp. BO4]|nr:hypothetical protein [Nitrospira sp. BO4]